ncbi:hypothetical protein ACFQ7F_09705 [Streptomyces sp. NPDC056486]|uniref:hypothetical protein n=1 Tax=Streptomyces sp. NPDC056486 TaxID=3345835 RepID=UPI0036CE6CBB
MNSIVDLWWICIKPPGGVLGLIDEALLSIEIHDGPNRADHPDRDIKLLMIGNQCLNSVRL